MYLGLLATSQYSVAVAGFRPCHQAARWGHRPQLPRFIEKIRLLHHIQLRRFKSRFRNKCISKCLFTWLICLYFASLTQLLTGCSNLKAKNIPPNSSSTISQQDTEILFPLQQEGGGYLDAKLQGKLTLINNCLYLEDTSAAQNYLLIWPHNFSYRVKGKIIQVLNGDKEVLVEERQRIWVSGGEYPTSVIPDDIPPDSDCAGPYWGVGLEVKVVVDK